MSASPSDGFIQLNGLASARMESGIALLNAGAPDALPEAIRYFDEAIEIRRRLPLAEVPGFRYGLAAGWINRGDALARLGGLENLVEAVTSYTAAIELLKDAPPDDDGSFVRRLAIAWTNRGLALEEQAEENAWAEAQRSHQNAIDILSAAPRGADDKTDLVLAGAWVNLGNASLRFAGSAMVTETCVSTEQALRLLAKSEARDATAAEAGLKARHVLCQALVRLLAAADRDSDLERELVGKITDAVESALSLARDWEKGGVSPFRPLATQLFHLGVLAYEQHQPQFLGEFLVEHLNLGSVNGFSPSGDAWVSLAKQSLARLRAGLRDCDFAALATPQGLRQLEILNEVRAVEERLEFAAHKEPRPSSSCSCSSLVLEEPGIEDEHEHENERPVL